MILSPESIPVALAARIESEVQAGGGFLPFDRFMAIALYEPGLGYYARGDTLFGPLPDSGSDFVTAPELSPLFGRTLAVQLRQALQASGTDEIWEFGAGSGALAAELLQALGGSVRSYHIVELSAALRAQQQTRLARVSPGPAAQPVHWHDRLPQTFSGVVIGNEVLDAMPVKLLTTDDGERWFERGIGPGLVWRDTPTALRPPAADRLGRDRAYLPGAVTELHQHALGFIRTLAATLERGAAFFIDYGFPEHEYRHPQRHGGTLMCHRGHRADTDPLQDLGLKDITAHIDFSAIALAAQDAGLAVLGYTSQARFLLNCGIAPLLQAADPIGRVRAQPLILEHEMGELFKVIGFAAGIEPFEAIGFAAGDRSHTL